MAHFKKISTTLSVAASVLLEACSSAGSDATSAPVAVANTSAPELVASWQTGCIITQNSGSAGTITQASGSGSGGGSGGVSGGAAFRSAAVFKQDGHVEFSTENFATSNCNANTLSSYSRYEAVYFVGAAGSSNDGRDDVTEISYQDTSSTSYSVFQLVNGSTLYLGDVAASSPGRDGSSEDSRLDGFGSDAMTKQ